jgi:hypothetical protein
MNNHLSEPRRREVQSTSIFDKCSTSGMVGAGMSSREPSVLEAILSDLLVVSQRLENIGTQARINADRIVGGQPMPCGTDGQKSQSPDGLISMIRLQIDFIFQKCSAAEIEVERLNNI